MATTLYRRHSMAQLYEKLRAQDDEDDMAWLAQYSPDDKSDEPYVPAAPSPPSMSSSPTSSYSSGPSFSDPGFDNESSEDPFDTDSDSEGDPESSGSAYTALDASSCSPLLFQPVDVADATPTDFPYVPSAHQTAPIQSRSPALSVEPEPSSLPTLALLPTPPPVASRRTTRSSRKSSTRDHSPVAFQVPNEDVYSESDGNGSEDEYIPSPTLGSRKRRKSTRFSAANGPASQKRSTESANKRPRQSPLPRNAQAAPGVASVSPVTKSNPWACPYCRWVQRNHRTPDLKRHIRTHTRLQRPAQWVCCGVPVQDADNYNIPAGAQPYVWAGEMMVGGCCKEFSRRDALKRHLDNDHINCVGNFSAFASICEDDA